MKINRLERIAVFLLCGFFSWTLAQAQPAPGTGVPTITLPSQAAKSPAPNPIAAQPVPIAEVPKATAVVPAAPTFDVKAYILIDANTGYVIAENNSDVRLPPASLTKLMTLYITANSLKVGQIHFTDPVTISENAWRMGGSKMFIKVGSTVPVQDLINGIVIASGNDASVAMAEFLAGTEQNFVSIMNQTASNLGMKNTSYTDSNGLPAQNHFSSARDLSILAKAWINNFPEYYPWFKERWITFNKIKQSNRNRLLWRDSSVDGMKTGHTDEAGYCLIASAVRNGMRLISVIMGAKNDNARLAYSESLLNYGFRFYETHKLFAANTALSTPRVWFGKSKTAKLGVNSDLLVTVPIGQYQNLKASAVITKHLQAPIVKGEAYGTIDVYLNDKQIMSKPLVALEDVPKANFLFSIFDYFSMMMAK